MGIITFIEHDGNKLDVKIEEGETLMQIALNNAVSGIDADCGGSCACGTCHVIVDKKWFATSGTASIAESQILEMTPERSSTSRLSCQVKISEDMDGMIVRLPEFQM